MKNGGRSTPVSPQTQFEALYGVSKSEMSAWLKRVNNTPQARSLMKKAGQR